MNAADSQFRVGFIGAGKMATALASGLCRAGFTTPEKILASDVSREARESFSAQSGARAGDSNADVLLSSEIVVLAVKPQHMRQVLEELKNHIGPQHLVVSIAAGVSLE